MSVPVTLSDFEGGMQRVKLLEISVITQRPIDLERPNCGGNTYGKGLVSRSQIRSIVRGGPYFWDTPS